MKRTLKRIFQNAQGEPRTVFRLLARAACYAAVLFSVLYGLGAIFGALFRAWGLTRENLSRAPVWAQQIVLWHTDFCYALAYVAALAVGLWLSRKQIKRRKNARAILFSVISSLGMAAGLTLAALGFDCMRLERPLSEPMVSLSLLSAALVTVLGKVSAEVLTKRLIFDAIPHRIWAYCTSVLTTTLLCARLTSPISILNGLLLGWVSCALYERGGLIAASAFRSVWTIWTSLIFGFPGAISSVGAVYALYHVSESWLTGGTFGPESGLWTTLSLLILLAVLFQKELRLLANERILHGRHTQNAKAASAPAGRSRRGNRA